MKNVKISFSLILALVMILSITNFVGAEGQNGTTLSASVTMTPHWVRTFHWTIDKSVTPEILNMFRGDAQSVDYTVAVTKDNGTDEAYIDGQVCITNGGAVDTESLAVTVNLTMPPDQSIIASSTVSLGSNPVILAGATQCYNYSIPVTSPVAGSEYKVTADITITNHSGYLGEKFGPSPSTSGPFLASPVLVNDSVNVDDSNGSSWLFNTSGSVSYSRSFTCDADNGSHDNTATIRETGQSASAAVAVHCFSLTVTKDAATSFTRTYGWNISKSVDHPTLILALNQAFTVNYDVMVSMTGGVDSDWAVAGNIHVANPAPMAAVLTSVSDVLSGIGVIPVDCGVSFPYNLPSGGTLDCTYTNPLPDATSRTNVATATIQNTPSGHTDFSSSPVDVNFSNAAMTELDECINVSDSYAGFLGTVCYPESSTKTFSYSRQIGPFDVCGEYTIDNVASFGTNDLGLTGLASASVAANVPCDTGCTLTIGYWKTHAGFGPQADMVSPLLPRWLGYIIVDTPEKAVQYLSFYGSNNVFNASNPVNKLYAQLLAAKLNIANGADDTSISSTIAQANTFLVLHDSLSKLSKSEKDMILIWMNTLDKFNNGLIGPGHCSQ